MARLSGVGRVGQVELAGLSVQTKQNAKTPQGATSRPLQISSRPLLLSLTAIISDCNGVGRSEPDDVVVAECGSGQDRQVRLVPAWKRADALCRGTDDTSTWHRPWP